MEPGPANRPPGGDDFRLAARSHTIATGTIVARGKQMFLTDSWYVAANGLEVGRAPFARTILNQPIACQPSIHHYTIQYHHRLKNYIYLLY